MTRLVGLFFALACLLGCGGEPVAVQRGAALQPPINCCVPRPLPNGVIVSQADPVGPGQYIVCSADPPFYTSAVCSRLTQPAQPALVTNGWTSNGWFVSYLRTDVHTGLAWHYGVTSTTHPGLWDNHADYPPTAVTLTFTWADRIDVVQSWAQ